MKHLWVSLFLILLTSSCIPKRNMICDIGVQKADIPIFIELPSNQLVFDNIVPLLYDSLYHHYVRVGYTLVNDQAHGYSIRVNVRALDPYNKLVSPDLVLMHYTVRAELDCILYNFNNEVVAQKTFLFSRLISKPRDPILSSDFLDFEYKRLFDRSVPAIERFFRPYLLKAFE